MDSEISIKRTKLSNDSCVNSVVITQMRNQENIVEIYCSSAEDANLLYEMLKGPKVSDIEFS